MPNQLECPFWKKVTMVGGNLPQERLCLIHNDFRMDNVVLNYEKPSQVIGVLDWEMATIGDPLMDLGNSLAYWIQAMMICKECADNLPT